MDIKPIRTQRDYKAALAEIERLFDAKPGTPDGDRLEVLATLVEAYEQQHYPILPPDPVEAILYFMETRGLSRADLEPYLGSRAKVSEVLANRPIAMPSVEARVAAPKVAPMMRAPKYWRTRMVART